MINSLKTEFDTKFNNLNNSIANNIDFAKTVIKQTEFRDLILQGATDSSVFIGDVIYKFFDENNNNNLPRINVSKIYISDLLAPKPNTYPDIQSTRIMSVLKSRYPTYETQNGEFIYLLKSTDITSSIVDGNIEYDIRNLNPILRFVNNKPNAAGDLESINSVTSFTVNPNKGDNELQSNIFYAGFSLYFENDVTFNMKNNRKVYIRTAPDISTPNGKSIIGIFTGEKTIDTDEFGVEREIRPINTGYSTGEDTIYYKV